ncbi:MAG: substrate-binding domain-containing protein [Candidatus Limnocylindria bacterium]
MNSPLRPLAVLFAGLLLIAACQPSASGSPPESGAAPSGDELAGDIQVSGSSTVKPITSLVAEAFGAMHPSVTYFVDGPGTGDGFALFCNDETDVNDASRPISEEEIALCQDAGVEYIELKIAIDGLSVITSAFNSDVSCLSFLDLYALLGPESQGLETWDAANGLAAELEGQLHTEFGESHAPYGAFPLDVTAPGEESGTFDSFVELAIRGIADAREQERTTRPDYTPSGDDNVIIEGVAGTEDAPHTLGWVGFAYADENSDRVQLLEVDKGDGCVAATPETIASAEYPLSRFLYIYVNTVRADANPALQAFVDYYLSDEGIAFVTEADYVALDPADLDETRAAWESR